MCCSSLGVNHGFVCCKIVSTIFVALLFQHIGMADTSAQHTELIERFRALVGKHKIIQGDLVALQHENASLREESDRYRASFSSAAEQNQILQAQISESAEVKAKLLEKARSLATHGKDLRTQLEACTATVNEKDLTIEALKAELAVARNSTTGEDVPSGVVERLRVRESQLESLHALIAELQVIIYSLFLYHHAVAHLKSIA